MTTFTASSKSLVNSIINLAWSPQAETELSRQSTSLLLSEQAIVHALCAEECDRNTMHMKMNLLRLRTAVEVELRRRWSPTELKYTR